MVLFLLEKRTHSRMMCMINGIHNIMMARAKNHRKNLGVGAK